MTERSGFRFIFKKTPLMLAVILVFCTLAQMADAAVAKTVRLTAGKASTIDLPKAAVDILVANPDIADVGALKSNRLYIVGKAVGDTNVLAFNESGDLIADITVRVKVDEGSLLDSLKQFFPDEDIQVKTVNRDIVLSGEVS